MPKFWPRPRSQTFGLSLASISLSYYVIGHFFGQKLCKIPEFLLIFPAITLNRMLLIIIWYFFRNYFWPRPMSSTSRNWPQPCSSGLSLGLQVLASFKVTVTTNWNCVSFWCVVVQNCFCGLTFIFTSCWYYSVT